VVAIVVVVEIVGGVVDVAVSKVCCVVAFSLELELGVC
jgi:hypothetical protein